MVGFSRFQIGIHASPTNGFLLTCLVRNWEFSHQAHSGPREECDGGNNICSLPGGRDFVAVGDKSSKNSRGDLRKNGGISNSSVDSFDMLSKNREPDVESFLDSFGY